MKQGCAELFLSFPSLIVFIHGLSAIIWIGGMIAIRFAVHFSLQQIEDSKIKLQTTLLMLKYFFNWVIAAIVLLLITAVIMSGALPLNSTIMHYKEAIWGLMTLIFMAVYIKRHKAQRYFENNELNKAQKELQPIALYLIPVNILLGLGALFLGSLF